MHRHNAISSSPASLSTAPTQSHPVSRSNRELSTSAAKNKSQFKRTTRQPTKWTSKTSAWILWLDTMSSRRRRTLCSCLKLTFWIMRKFSRKHLTRLCRTFSRSCPLFNWHRCIFRATSTWRFCWQTSQSQSWKEWFDGSRKTSPKRPVRKRKASLKLSAVYFIYSILMIRIQSNYTSGNFHRNIQRSRTARPARRWCRWIARQKAVISGRWVTRRISIFRRWWFLWRPWRRPSWCRFPMRHVACC